jgi:hypothetical protein
MRSPSPNAADPISDLSVGRDAFHPSLPSHSSQVTLPDNHLDTLTGDVIPAVVVALLLGLLELVDVLSQDRPGPAVLATRLERMLAGGDVVAVLAGEPAMAVALVTMRPNVWYDGPVALLDELCVAPGSRGQGVGSACWPASRPSRNSAGPNCSRLTSTGTTPMPGASMSGTATPTVNRARSNRSFTTTDS